MPLPASPPRTLRFLGRKLHPALAAEVTTDAHRRPEGWRVKHRPAANTIKLYDKANLLRVETTINDPARSASCAANERYLDALAACCETRHGTAVLDRGRARLG